MCTCVCTCVCVCVFTKLEASKPETEMRVSLASAGRETRATYTVFAVGVAVTHMLHPTLGGSGRG